MVRIFLISLLLIISLNSCAKKKDDKLVSSQQNPYNVYEEGLEAFNKNDYFFAHKKFSESEIIFEDSLRSILKYFPITRANKIF